jgi:arginine repressor
VELMSICPGIASSVRTVLDTVRAPLILGNFAEDNWALIKQFFNNTVLGALFQIFESVLDLILGKS